MRNLERGQAVLVNKILIEMVIHCVLNQSKYRFVLRGKVSKEGTWSAREIELKAESSSWMSSQPFWRVAKSNTGLSEVICALAKLGKQ